MQKNNSKIEEKVLNLVFEAMEETDEQLSSSQKLEFTKETALFGKSGNLDSLGLVNLIVAVEEKLEEEFGKHISIADEKAMSQERSPFRTVDSLVQYTISLLQE